MQEYLDVAELRKNPVPLRKMQPLISGFIFVLASLTDEEIAAIDEAGAKGVSKSVLITRFLPNTPTWLWIRTVALFSINLALVYAIAYPLYVLYNSLA